MEKSEYKLIHQWVRYHYGNATKCENKDCSSESQKRFEWALKKGHEYERKVTNFTQLCPSCHRKYDLTEKQAKRLKEPRRSVHHETIIEKIKLTKRGEVHIFNSTKEAAEKLGINRRSIYNVLAGEAKSVGGYNAVKL